MVSARKHFRKGRRKGCRDRGGRGHRVLETEATHRTHSANHHHTRQLAGSQTNQEPGVATSTQGWGAAPSEPNSSPGREGGDGERAGDSGGERASERCASSERSRSSETRSSRRAAKGLLSMAAGVAGFAGGSAAVGSCAAEDCDWSPFRLKASAACRPCLRASSACCSSCCCRCCWLRRRCSFSCKLNDEPLALTALHFSPSSSTRLLLKARTTRNCAPGKWENWDKISYDFFFAVGRQQHRHHQQKSRLFLPSNYGREMVTNMGQLDDQKKLLL